LEHTGAAASSPPTIYDVAQRAGVSIATVSRVLNGHSYLRPETRDRVLHAVRELRFVPNGSARGLSSRSKKIIGLVFVRHPAEQDLLQVEQESLLFTDSVIRGAELAAHRCGYSLLLSGVGDSDAGPAVQALTGRTDGLIILDQVLPERKVAPLAKRFPIVLLAGSGRSRTAATVRVDNVAGMRAVAEHLVGGHAYRRLSFLSGIADSPDSATRRQAFVAAAEALGGTCAEGEPWVADYTSSGAVRAVQRVLASGQPLPDAIVCANDQMAIGALQALLRAGIRVPEDVAVTGFDDLPVVRHLHPGLTTIRQPIQQLGSAAVDLLVTLVERGPEATREVVFPVELVVRGSCGCLEPQPELTPLGLQPWRFEL
jgi:LacI family transcriptional regulator